MDCIFCSIVRGEIPETFRYEDDDIVAFDDLHPKAPTHVLIIPRRHIPTVHDLETSDRLVAGGMMLAARRIAEDAGIGETGYRLIINCKNHGGQEVPHLHMHLLGGIKLGKAV
jgi:histidine triad (HIT) family protein